MNNRIKSILKYLLNTIICLTIFGSKSNATIYYITNAGPSGVNQLTNAINAANLTTSKDSIYFNIPGMGPHILSFTTWPLEILNPILIDGLTQPGNDTVNWSIRLAGVIQLKVNSGNCIIRGLRFQDTQASWVNTTAIHLTNEDPAPGTGPGLNVADWVIEMNYFEDFTYGVNCDLDYTSSFPSLSNLQIRLNKFYDNQYPVRLGWTTGVTYQNVNVEENYFYQNTEVALSGGEQIQPLNFVVRKNYFYNTGLEFSGRLNAVTADSNQFAGVSIATLSSARTDSIIIAYNIFKDDAALVAYLVDTLSRALYITNNSFESDNNKKLTINVGGAGGLHKASGIYIKYNEFKNNHGMIIRNSVTSGNSRITNCEISNNSMSYSSAGFTGSLIDFYISSTGGTVKADSIYISDNIINGGRIEYSQTGTSSNSRYGEAIFIRRNTLLNAIGPGVQIDISKNTVRHIVIDSNYVSNCDRGIEITNRPGSGYSGSINDVSITNNRISKNTDCGIAVLNIPQSGPAEMDSIYIANNTVDSNIFDGIRLWTVMQTANYLNEMKKVTVVNNTIFGNTENGIAFTDFGNTSGTLISPVLNHLTYSLNSIYNNGMLGIKITNQNDPLLPSSPIFPVPVITTITNLNPDFTIDGILQGVPATTYSIELFRNQIPDPSGFGEGEIFITNQLVTTDFSGFAQFQILVTGSPGTWYYSTTATNTNTGNSSEFSNAADITVGIHEMKEQSMHVYPNPCSNRIAIGLNNIFEKNLTITIYDLFGRPIERLFSGEVNSNNWNQDLDISTLKNGIYTLRVTGEIELMTKVVKM